jgi:exonuclease 1
MNLLVSKGIDFVVAPYEADCQIAKLQKLNIIDAAITEDSDLVVYGVKVILKLKETG